MNRVGIGYDLHRLVEGRALILGGVQIEHTRGLEGHSDADVLLHALMDAMLGAAGLRDIGFYFPPGDEQYRNISSLALLHDVKRIVERERWKLVNADAVIVAEAPLLAPHIEAMRANIAGVFAVTRDVVSVKATTTEQLGVCGREEGIAATVVVLLEDDASQQNSGTHGDM
ncbi:MAG TPA: 2-C-methyl-D-erythritol 2,4-cyclodiphosphate synthase [Candidatus Limnocylindrales bacterium]|nr:2-C-methyl-D-erythritol 2,4-cyclodiphosphate synthase [Candidatus Limnocylindrales bacterium]